ncbi:MAG: hypothetical protein D6741_19690 [Planctomycetota bacterium]|nr:MAG: hypothetical protein D6741_19690 [Planctomycetota bacterium]
MGGMSRNKGKRGEREAAEAIRRLFGTTARRGVQYAGDPTAPDVTTSIPHVHFEVKRTESFRLYRALEQATGDAGENVPVVLYRANRKPWVAIVALEELPRLATLLHGVLTARE